MENLSLDGPEAGHAPAPAPPLGPASGPSGPGPNQQLPPQMFTTAAQLLDMTDSEYIQILLFVCDCVLGVRGYVGFGRGIKMRGLIEFLVSFYILLWNVLADQGALSCFVY